MNLTAPRMTLEAVRTGKWRPHHPALFRPSTARHQRPIQQFARKTFLKGVPQVIAAVTLLNHRIATFVIEVAIQARSACRSSWCVHPVQPHISSISIQAGLCALWSGVTAASAAGVASVATSAAGAGPAATSVAGAGSAATPAAGAGRRRDRRPDWVSGHIGDRDRSRRQRRRSEPGRRSKPGQRWKPGRRPGPHRRPGLDRR